MTAAGSSMQRPRASRARAVVVGRGESIRELAALLRRHIAAVSEIETLLDAVADVGLSPAREPVSAVIVSADCEGFDMQRVVAAFRRADPLVPLILAVRQGQEDLIAEAIAEDFEHSLVLPTNTDELLPVLYELGVMQPRREAKELETRLETRDAARQEAARARLVPPEPQRDEAATAPAERGVVELAIEDALAGASRGRQEQPPPEHARLEVKHPEIRHPETRHPETRHAEPKQPEPRLSPRRHAGFTMPAPIPSPPRDGPPGDIDLVRAVLEHSDLQAAALRVLRHHLGTTDVRFIAAPRPGEEAAVALDRRGLRQAEVAGEGHTYGVLVSTTLDEATLSAWAVWLSHWLRLEESHRELRRFAWTDDLTAAGNRRAFETLLRETMSRAIEERRTISVMCLDIDDFKRYNDDYGHHAGDEVLREIAELLRTCVRAGDHVFRIGGDEFVVVFCDASAPRKGGGSAPESVEAIARRFQKAVAELRLPSLSREGPGTVTVSAGVAVFPWEGHDPESLLRRADLRALESKRNGKNLITFGPGAEPDAGG
jgi:diguanylate cyclase (GGDEF)-like protein